MPKTCYVDKTFTSAHLALIETANEIIEEYSADGYLLTLRQLYYQFVARDVIPNKQSEYKRLGGIVNDARLAGLIDWGTIEDRGRELKAISSWDSPGQIVSAVADQFQLDLWEGQEYRPEVWIEKEALVGVISRICQELRVPHFACKGYVSQSAMWKAGARRFAGYRRQDQTPYVLHFGDHDPSGIDMTRDIRDRLEMFSRRTVKLKRMALNMDQVEQYGPPPNPAKVTDSRFEGYVVEYGEESWELDALEPATLAALVRGEILSIRDEGAWDGQLEEEEEAKTTLSSIADNWTEVRDFAADL